MDNNLIPDEKATTNCGETPVINLQYIEGPALDYHYNGKNLRADIATIREHGHFNHVWYKKCCELRNITLDTPNMIQHYLTVGAAAGLDPEHNFDTRFYLTSNNDVRLSGHNPYVHYLKYGEQAGRKPYRHKFICKEMNYLVITTDGDVSPCCVDVRKQNTFGNIYQESYAELQHKFIQYRMDLFRNPQKYPGCVECLHNCQGSSGGMRLVDYCTVQPQRAQIADFFGKAKLMSTRFHIEPASICNATCSTCFIFNKDFRRSQELIDFEKVARSFGEKIREVSHMQLFFYGEPFMNPRTGEFLNYLADHAPDVKVIFSTNGVYLKAQHAQELVEAAKKISVTVWSSLHGSNQQNVRLYMGDTFQFEKALKNISYLSRLRDESCQLEIVWKYVLFSWNDSDADLREVEQRARTAGYDQIEFYLTKQPSPSRRFTLNSEAWKNFGHNKEVLSENVIRYNLNSGYPILPDNDQALIASNR